MAQRQATVGFLLVLALLLGLLPVQAGAEEFEVQVTFSGTPVQFEVPPLVRQGRTFVPVRFVLERIGAQLEWNGESRQVTIVLGDRKVGLTIDSPVVSVEGQSKEIDVAPFIYRDRTMVPLRFIAETFDFSVHYNDQTRTVSLVPPDAAPPVSAPSAPSAPAAGPAVAVEAPSSARVGEDFVVRVQVIGGEQIRAMAIRLRFDPVKVEALQVKPGSIVEGLTVSRTIDNQAGSVTYITGLVGSSSFSGDGTYFEVGFRARSAGQVRIGLESANREGPVYTTAGYLSVALRPAEMTVTP